MSLDLWLLGIVAAVGAMGLFSGAIKQLAQWMALAVAYVFARPIAAALAPDIVPKLGLPRGVGPVALTAALMLLSYILGTFVFKAILKRFLTIQEKSSGDRFGGLALGAAKGAALVYVGLCVVVSFDEPLAKSGWDLKKETAGSRGVAFAQGHNLFDTLKLPALERAKSLAAARNDPEQLRKLMDDPRLRSFAEDPQVKAALSDPELRRAVAGGNPAALLQDPRVKKLLDDPELAKKLRELESVGEK